MKSYFLYHGAERPESSTALDFEKVRQVAVPVHEDVGVVECGLYAIVCVGEISVGETSVLHPYSYYQTVVSAGSGQMGGDKRRV